MCSTYRKTVCFLLPVTTIDRTSSRVWHVCWAIPMREQCIAILIWPTWMWTSVIVRTCFTTATCATTVSCHPTRNATLHISPPTRWLLHRVQQPIKRGPSTFFQCPWPPRRWINPHRLLWVSKIHMTWIAHKFK